MSICIIKLDHEMDSSEALIKRLEAEIKMLRRLKVNVAKVMHGSSSDTELSINRRVCRNYLYEQLNDNKIKALCPGERFGPFEKDGQSFSRLARNLRSDLSWGRNDDSFVMILLD